MGRVGRLPEYDYSGNGCYFITFCTKGRRSILSDIVGRDDLGAPQVKLRPAGESLERYIRSISEVYPEVSVDRYVIMPNHVHLLLTVDGSGAPGSSRPTGARSRQMQLIPRLIAVLKKYTNRDTGANLWQSTYHDHVIRNQDSYLQIWNYIDTNPAKWAEDRYYSAEKRNNGEETS